MRLHFIVGTGRCGSSLLHEILCRHEQVGFVSNVDDRFPRLVFNGRFNNALYSATRGGWTRKGRLRFAPSEAYRLISKEASPIYADSCRDLTGEDVTPWLRQRFEQFFLTRSQAQGRPFFLHKYTGWSRIGFFAEIFPAARFIHVVRDGRAVANSLLQMRWWQGYRGPEEWHWGALSEGYRREWEAAGCSFVVLAGIAWKILMESFESAARDLEPGRYMVARYEDFLERPRESLDSIAAFLELPRSTRLASALGDMRLDAARRRGFESELTGEQRTQLDRCLASALARYGYSV
jgi:hypothetical protein